ncbi:hypothetical protein G3I15_56315, partial [Streptomyces sp. SID10244]|nr:hypothetical protein [Streptomyces sp. SID10244]
DGSLDDIGNGLGHRTEETGLVDAPTRSDHLRGVGQVIRRPSVDQRDISLSGDVETMGCVAVQRPVVGGDRQVGGTYRAPQRGLDVTQRPRHHAFSAQPVT